MAKITPDELWSLAVETGLVAGPAAAALRAEHAAVPGAAGADAKAVAAWLVDKEALTRWQAKRLATGDAGPFFYGDYRLLDRHEHDGEAFEFTARHEPSGREVALVLLGKKPWRDPEVRAAIVRRVTNATETRDPLLVRTWTLEEDDGRPFVICEEVRGESLAEDLAHRGALPLREAGEIVLAAARAVAELHAAGDVHGGLSLDAFVRGPAAAGGGWRLRQFPLATDPHQVPQRALVEGEAELFQLGRRAAFVAPELAAGGPCDRRSDVYALGCILHALVTGTAPNWRGDARETLERAAAVGPGPLDPDVVPGPLARLIGHMTARDPRDRYPHAAEAARAVATCFGLPQPDVADPEPDAPAGPASPSAFDVAPSAGSVPSFAGAAAAPRAAANPRAVREAATESARRRGRRLRLVGGALAGAIVAAAVAIVVEQTMPPPRPVRDDDVERVAVRPPRPPAPRQEPRDEPTIDAMPHPPAAEAAAPPKAAGEGAGAAGPQIVDDPKFPWASPTSGGPPVLAYLPEGSQLILVARPSAMLADEEGRLLVRALGPSVDAALAAVATACGCEPADVETLEAGWQVGEQGEVVVGWTARLVDGKTLPADDAFRTRTWGAGRPADRDGETIHAGPALSYWAPAQGGGRVLVAAPAKQLEAIVQESSGADPPPLALPGALERLAGALDGSRHVTLVGSPYYVLNAGRPIFGGALQPLAARVEDLFGDQVQAAALSVHCGKDFYVELDAVPAVDVAAAKFAEGLAERIRAYPNAVRAFCAARDLHPYGRALVMDLPAMVRVLAANARGGAEGKVVVVNAYLPRHAGHNIALAAELALAQASSSSGAAAGPAQPAAPAPRDAVGRLGQKMTLVFAKDTLEKSIQMISDEIGVPMEIRGPDLQLEGITKNQSFALDEKDKPAGEILRVILARSNPDGKLVYVVRKTGDSESIEITTRAAAAKRGDALPTQFQDADPKPAKGGK